MEYELRDELVINYINFKRVAKMLGHAYGVPLMKAMEQLSRVFGYASFHQVVALVGPNGERTHGRRPLSADQLEKRLVEFFGPIEAPFSPKLSEQLLRLARLREKAPMG